MEAQRRVEERRFEEVETGYGRVRMKISGNGFAPEYEDCRALAAEKHVAVKDVMAAAQAAYWAQQHPR